MVHQPKDDADGNLRDDDGDHGQDIDRRTKRGRPDDTMDEEGDAKAAQDLDRQRDRCIEGGLLDRFEEQRIAERCREVVEPHEPTRPCCQGFDDRHHERDRGQHKDRAEDRQEQLVDEPLLPGPAGPPGPHRDARADCHRARRRDVHAAR